MILYKEYIDTIKDNVKIKFTITFNKQTTSWATSQKRKIGYQVTVIPVEISKTGNVQIESFGAFTGFNDCLLEIDRQSKKRLETAIENLKTKKEFYLNHLNEHFYKFKN